MNYFGIMIRCVGERERIAVLIVMFALIGLLLPSVDIDASAIVIGKESALAFAPAAMGLEMDAGPNSSFSFALPDGGIRHLDLYSYRCIGGDGVKGPVSWAGCEDLGGMVYEVPSEGAYSGNAWKVSRFRLPGDVAKVRVGGGYEMAFINSVAEPAFQVTRVEFLLIFLVFGLLIASWHFRGEESTGLENVVAATTLIGGLLRLDQLYHDASRRLLLDGFSIFLQAMSFDYLDPFALGFKEPLFPALAQPFIALYGGGELGLRVFTLALSVAAIPLAYKCMRLYLGDVPAAFSSFAVAFHPYLIFMSAQGHRLEMFMVLAMAFAYFMGQAAEGRTKAALVCGSMVLFRLESIIFMPLAILALGWGMRPKRELAAMALIPLLISLPILFSSWAETGRPLHYLDRHTGWYGGGGISERADGLAAPKEGILDRALAAGAIGLATTSIRGYIAGLSAMVGVTWAPLKASSLPVLLVLAWAVSYGRRSLAAYSILLILPYSFSLGIEARYRYVFQAYPFLAGILGALIYAIFKKIWHRGGRLSSPP